MLKQLSHVKKFPATFDKVCDLTAERLVGLHNYPDESGALKPNSATVFFGKSCSVCRPDGGDVCQGSYAEHGWIVAVVVQSRDQPRTIMHCKMAFFTIYSSSGWI